MVPPLLTPVNSPTENLRIAVHRKALLGAKHARLQQVVQQLKDELLLRRIAAANKIKEVQVVEQVVAPVVAVKEVEQIGKQSTARLNAALVQETQLTLKVDSLVTLCHHLRSRIRKRVGAIEKRQCKRMKTSTATTCTCTTVPELERTDTVPIQAKQCDDCSAPPKDDISEL